jgi:hypothetical protein
LQRTRHYETPSHLARVGIILRGTLALTAASSARHAPVVAAEIRAPVARRDCCSLGAVTFQEMTHEIKKIT